MWMISADGLAIASIVFACRRNSIPHAIIYFMDAEGTEEPMSFKNQTWEQVKKGIQQAVRDYLK